jgi:hypothetical protein
MTAKKRKDRTKPDIDPPGPPVDPPNGPPTQAINKIMEAFNNDHDGQPFEMNGVSIDTISEFPCENGNAVLITSDNNPVGDPLVIVNPPTIVPDPSGDIVIGEMTFREDPMDAITRVVRDYGGVS